MRIKIKNVPAILTFDPQLGGVLDRVQKGAAIVPNTMRMLGGTAHTRDVEVLAVGLPSSGTVWEVPGMGLKTILIQRTGGKSKKVDIRTVSKGESVKIKKPLSNAQKKSWADVVRPQLEPAQKDNAPATHSDPTENFIPAQASPSQKQEPRGRGRPRSSTPSRKISHSQLVQTTRPSLQQTSNGNEQSDMAALLNEMRRANKVAEELQKEIACLRKENEELKAKLFQLLNAGERPMEGLEVDLKRRRSQEDRVDDE